MNIILRTRNGYFVLFAAISMFLSHLACANDEQSVQDLKRENAALTLEVDLLKQENKQLKNLLLEKQNKDLKTPPSEASSSNQKQPANQSNPNPKIDKPSSKPASAFEYWITTSSGKRHNSGCRFFGTSKGHLGGANEATACRICGG